MSHFARVVNEKVVMVIVAEEAFITSLPNASEWIQTSYNAHGGVHSLGGTPIRKNYAGVGYTYDVSRDAFYAPKPFPSWVLDSNTCLWNAPIPYPTGGGIYKWDEASLSWAAI